MRILLDYRPALRHRTGVGYYTHELAVAMLDRLAPGESLTVFSSSWKDRLRPGTVPGARQVDRRIPVALLNAAWHWIEWPPIEALAGPVDVAHSLHPLLLPARRAIQVVTVYDLDFLDAPERTRAEIRRDYPRLARAHAARADLVVVISEYTAGNVTRRLGVPRERIVMCRPGAPAWPPPSVRHDGGPILFVGTIEPRKNLPALFAAYERVVGRRPDAPPLVLAGGTVEASRDILEALGRRRALAGRVRHLGYVSDEERERLYQEACMLVLPSLDEGFGMPALEAMHMGVPVVASRRGALPEVIGEAGRLVDPEREDELADAIEEVLADAALRERYRAAGQARAREFSWGDSASRLLEAYREAVRRRRAGAPA